MGGKLRSQITCETCNYHSDTFDETFTFNVPLPAQNQCTFQEALTQFCSVDLLRKDNKYLCPKCKSKQNAKKSLCVAKAPRVLIVTVKRFDIFGKKVNRRIKYPSTFNLKKHMVPAMDQPDNYERQLDEVYDLYGVCVHSGWSSSSGHYYSYCKTGTGADGKWFECDDSHVAPTTEREALAQEAYMLFYQKRVQKEAK